MFEITLIDQKDSTNKATMRMHTLVIFQKILTISFILGKITKYAFFFKLYSYLTKLVSRKCLLSIRILLAQNDSKNNDLL